MESRTKLQLGAALLIFAVGATTGCSTSTAPFHMYSSPLLEGEASAHPTMPSRADENGSGLQTRQVYTFQRWGGETQGGSQGRQIRAPEDRRGPRRDVADTYHGPVLAQVGGVRGNDGSTGASRTVSDASGRTTRPPIEAPTVEVDDAQRAATAAAYAHAVLSVNEVELSEDAASSVPELYRECRQAGGMYHSNRPNVGDLVFFHNTYDANQDGRNNDWYTLVGIIEGVNSRGGVDFLAFHQGRVQRMQLNLDAAGERQSNTQLREESADDPPFTQYMAGQLFAGFCDVLGDREDLVVIDNWVPGMELEEAP